MTPNADPELSAMSSVLSALEPLDQEAKARVISWVSSKLDIAQTYADRREGHAYSEKMQESLGQRREGTINTVCAKLGARSCREVLVAAAAHLALYEGRERFSRAEWIGRAKEAKNWKNEFSAQMSTGISRLLNNGFVNETAKDQFALTDDQIRDLASKIDR